MRNSNKCRCECKKDYTWNPIPCICRNSKYLKSIIADSITMCDDIIDAIQAGPTKSMSINYNYKKQPLQWIISIFYLNFYLLLYCH